MVKKRLKNGVKKGSKNAIFHHFSTPKKVPKRREKRHDETLLIKKSAAVVGPKIDLVFPFLHFSTIYKRKGGRGSLTKKSRQKFLCKIFVKTR